MIMDQSIGTDVNVDAIKEVSTVISEYGPLVVILAVFLIVFCTVLTFIMRSSQRSSNSIIEANNKFMDQLIKQNESLLDKINSKPEYESNIVEIFTKFNDIFKEECRDIISSSNAARASIYVFHDGATASHGLPFFKMSCVSEWIRRSTGLQTKLSSHTNLPLNIFGDLVEELYQKGSVDIKVCQSLDHAVHTFISNEMIKECILCSVYDENNKIMGYICAEYDDIIPEDKVKEIMRMIGKHCEKIRPVLQFSDYQDIIYK